MIMIIIVICLIILSATFSGLTIGMFSLSLSFLERKIKLGNKDAEKIYKFRKNGNRLLCTLLLGNVAINSAISLVMSELASGLVAGVISTTLIFLFGEVLPQATFARHAFYIGSKTTWLVWFLMKLLWPLAKPMSMLLDFIFGKELNELFSKDELEALLEDQSSKIDSDERRIMIGAMKYSDKTAVEVITPVTVLFRLESNTLLTVETVEKIKVERYSRVPVYSGNRDNIIGILYVKDLIGKDQIELDKISAGEICVKENLLFIDEDHKLDSLLNHFIKTKTHMSFVFNEFHVLIGIVTLEDVIEEILNIEILDEHDTVADLQHYAQHQERNTKYKEEL